MNVSGVIYSLVPLIPFILYVSANWHRLERPGEEIKGTVLTTLIVALAQAFLVKTSNSPNFKLSMGVPVLMALSVYYGKLPGLFGGSTGLGLGLALAGKPFYWGTLIGAIVGYITALLADPGDSMKVLTGTTVAGIVFVVLSGGVSKFAGSQIEMNSYVAIVEASTGVILSTATAELKKRRVEKVQTFNF